MGHCCRLTRQGGYGLKVGWVAFAQCDCNGLQTVHGQDQDDSKNMVCIAQSTD
jgi:hypothetical protein